MNAYHLNRFVCNILFIYDLSPVMDSSDDFYIYLSSEANKNEFKENNSSAFTNIIRPTIQLQDSYDVGVENIIFSPKVKNIVKNDQQYKIELSFMFSNGEDGYDLVGIFTYVPTKDIIFDNIQDIIAFLNYDFKKFLLENDVIEETFVPIFSYDYFKRIVRWSPLTWTPKYSLFEFNTDTTTLYSARWKFSPGMCSVLGILQAEQNTRTPICHLSPIIPNVIDYIFLYTDIVRPTNFGGQIVNLIDIVPMKNVYSKCGAKTLYKSVSSLIIDSISMKLSDKNGKTIDFEDDVNIVVVLHFKKTL